MAPWTRPALVMSVVVLIDQVTKKLVRAGMTPGDEDGIFPGVQFVYVRNRGVAFGAFAGGTTIVIVVIAVALVALLAYFATHSDRPLAWLATGLLVGGAVGNIFDRVRDGSVTDFIKLPGWPAFNVADIAITTGVLTLLYAIEREDGPDAPDRGR